MRDDGRVEVMDRRAAAKKEAVASKMRYEGEGRFSAAEVPINCCGEDRDMPEMSRAISSLMGVIDRYDNIVHRLHDRLSAVVVPSSTAAASTIPKCNYQTPLGMTLFEAGCRLSDITDNLEHLYERIEL